MKILVYGAGPLGSLLAAKLQQGGNAVSLLARGRRLADLREHGLVLVDILTQQTSVTQVNLVEALGPGDAYDLVLVVMRKNHALAILPILAQNQHTPNVLFLMNNAAGPDELVKALGPDRVLTGFPMAAGYREGHVVYATAGTEQEKRVIPFGEVDGQVTTRTMQVAQMLESAPGIGAEVRTDMDAWLKYHVALLMPAVVPALYACGTDHKRLARTRDAVVLGLRAMREGFQVLQSKGLPITPSALRSFKWMPEPIMVPMLQRLAANEKMEIALVKHATAAPDEMKHLTDEFMQLIRSTDLPTPNIDRLYPYFDPDTPRLPDGSATIPLDWRGVWAALGLAAGTLVSLVLIWRLFRKPR